MVTFGSPTPRTPGQRPRASDDVGSRRSGPPATVPPIRSIRIVTGARLHFGLLDTAPPFGGIGVMIDEPATEVEVRTADRFGCDRESESRAVPIASRVAERFGWETLPACRVRVVRRPPAHSGYGSGTQLSMAIAEGLCRFHGCRCPVRELAGLAGRGHRSAVGVHGFLGGGLVYESAPSPTDLNPIVARCELPSQWRVVLLRPEGVGSEISGPTEAQHFSRLTRAPDVVRRELERLIVDQILPAAQSRKFEAFASAVGQYNRQSGMLFESVQGGPYNSAEVAHVVGYALDRGAVGVGQSSWGPGVFAWFPTLELATRFAQQVPAHLAAAQISRVRNSSRRLTTCPG